MAIPPDQSVFLLQNALRFTFGSGAVFGTILGAIAMLMFVRVSMMRARLHHLIDCWLFRRPALGEFLAVILVVTFATIICAMWWGITPPNVGKLLKLLAV